MLYISFVMMKVYLIFLFYLVLTNVRQVDGCVLGIQKCTNPSIIWKEEKGYYLGIYFKANWYKAQHFCHYHGMELLSLSSKSELDYVIKIIKEFGIHPGMYWTSGNDLAEEGSFVWASTGRLIPKNTTMWVINQPDNARNIEHCVHLWDSYNYLINDVNCTYEYNFICETNICSNLKYCDL